MNKHLVIAGISLAASTLHAADYSWTAAESGAWGVAENWGTPAAPNAPDANAALSVAGAPYTVTLGSPIALADLDIASADATLAHTAGALTLHGTATISTGRYYLNGGTISGGTIEQDGGILDFGPAPDSTLDGTTVNGGVTVSLPDGSVRFLNSTINGGTRTDGTSNTVLFEESQVGGGVQVIGADGSVRFLNSTVTGGVRTDGTSNTVFFGETQVVGDVILDGTSNTIFFGEDAPLAGQNVYVNGDGNRLRADAGWTVTIGGDAVVYLRGDGAAIDSADTFGGVRNDGRIVADGTSNTVFIAPATFENTGDIEVRNGAIARIGDGTSNTILFGESRVILEDGSVRFISETINAGAIDAQGSTVEIDGAFVQNDGWTRFENSIVSIADGASATIAGGEFGGTGTVTGDLAFTGGTLAPGDMAITGDLSLAPGVRLAFDLRGTAQGLEYGFLSEAGSLALALDGVVLEITLGDGFVPLATDTFTILVSNEMLAGSFANVSDGGTLDVNGGAFSVTYAGTEAIVLSGFAPVPEPGALALLALAASAMALAGFRRRARR